MRWAKIAGIAGGIVALYFIDVWVLGSIAAVITATGNWVTGKGDLSLAGWYWNHPFDVAVSWITSGELSHPEVRQTWLLLNLMLGGIILVVYFGWKTQGLGWTVGSKELRLSQDPSHGTAGWMTGWELRKVLQKGFGPGILFGLVNNNPARLTDRSMLNRHVAVFGASGSMKSRAYIRNQIMQAVVSGESVIVTDPKGELYRDCAVYLENEGYDVKVFNLVSMTNSDRWNPLGEIRNDLDAQVFSEVVIANTSVPGIKKVGGDPFWDRGEQNLLKALALYVVYELPGPRRHLASLYSILASGDPGKIDVLFNSLKPSHPAKMPYNIFLQASDTVRSGIVIGLGTRLQVFQNETVGKLTTKSDIDLEKPGKERCAYFCIMPDTHSTFDFLASLFFSFLFIRLIELADKKGGPLPVRVNFLLDEFCNIGSIPDFTKKISTMRSRGMNCSIVFQNIGQLENRYPFNAWQEILGNCDSRLFLGTNDTLTAKYLADLLGVTTIETASHTRDLGVEGWFDPGKKTESLTKRSLLTVDEILRLPHEEAILILRGQKPLRLKKMDYTKHPEAKKLVMREISEYEPSWAREVDAQLLEDAEGDAGESLETEAQVDQGLKAPRRSFRTRGRPAKKQETFWGD